MPGLVSYTPEVITEPWFSRYRTGVPFFIDDFENYHSVITERWYKAGAAGSTIALATDYPETGKYCAKLTTDTGASDICNCRILIGTLRPQYKFGVEIGFQTDMTATNLESLTIDFANYDKANMHNGSIRFLGEANLKWQYRDSTNTFTDITNGDHDLYVGTTICWHKIKLVVDFERDEYVKMYCDEKEFDLSGLGLYVVADTTNGPYLFLSVDLANAVATAARTARIDNVVVTYKET